MAVHFSLLDPSLDLFVSLSYIYHPAAFPLRCPMVIRVLRPHTRQPVLFNHLPHPYLAESSSASAIVHVRSINLSMSEVAFYFEDFALRNRKLYLQTTF
jgi:hypothetical protein